MLGLKCWFMFLEDASPYAFSMFDGVADIESFEAHVKKMVSDIDRVTLDAAHEGISDSETFIDVLGKTDEAAEVFDIWWHALAKLREEAAQITESEGALDKEPFMQAHRVFTELSKTAILDFMRLCLNARGRCLEG